MIIIAEQGAIETIDDSRREKTDYEIRDLIIQWLNDDDLGKRVDLIRNIQS